MMTKRDFEAVIKPYWMPRYNSKGWVLCRCTVCGRLNYVEPHGAAAKCRCSPEWTEHENLPFASLP